MKSHIASILAFGLIVGLVSACNSNPGTTKINRSTYQGNDGRDEDSGNSTPQTPPKTPIDDKGNANDPSNDVESPTAPVNPPPVVNDPNDDAVSPPDNVTGAPVKDPPVDPRQIIINGKYFIKSAGALKCLSIANNSRDNGAALVQAKCDINSTAQRFIIEFKAAENAYSIHNQDSQKFLEIKDQNEVPTGLLQQNDFYGQSHQLFSIELKEEKRYFIRTLSKKLFMDVTGASTLDGAPIQLWENGNGISSVWIIEKAP